MVLAFWGAGRGVLGKEGFCLRALLLWLLFCFIPIVQVQESGILVSLLSEAPFNRVVQGKGA